MVLFKRGERDCILSSQSYRLVTCTNTCVCENCTHSIAMPQCLPALSPAAWKPESPMRVTVGVIVSGLMYFNRTPGKPKAPMITSIRDETIIAPWIYRDQERGRKTLCLNQITKIDKKHPKKTNKGSAKKAVKG